MAQTAVTAQRASVQGLSATRQQAYLVLTGQFPLFVQGISKFSPRFRHWSRPHRRVYRLIPIAIPRLTNPAKRHTTSSQPVRLTLEQGADFLSPFSWAALRHFLVTAQTRRPLLQASGHMAVRVCDQENGKARATDACGRVSRPARSYQRVSTLTRSDKLALREH